MSDPVSLAGCRILVVEDEYLIAMEVKRWLLTAGSEVLGPVPSAAQALDLIASRRPDAAVLDINLGGGGTVFPVADQLGVLGVAYLFATGATWDARVDAYGGRPLLEKPYLEIDLLRMLSGLVVRL